MTDSILLNGNQVSVEVMLRFLQYIGNEQKRSELLLTLDTIYPPHKQNEGKRNRLRQGYFSLIDIQIMMGDFISLHNLEGVANAGNLWNALLKKLSEMHLIQLGLIVSDEYSINSNRLHLFAEEDILDNVVFGVQFMLDKYKNSIPAVNVRSENGQDSCGSGVLLSIPNNQNTYYILTNRHVVEGNRIVSIKTKDLNFKLEGDIVLCSFADLALIPIQGPTKVPDIHLYKNPDILDSVISVGYPLIPTAADQYPLAHRGEVNGYLTNTTGQEFLAISCQVGPGNSGGPILSEMGLCAGLVTQSGVAEFGSDTSAHGSYKSTYHMAIPPSTIRKFLVELH